MAKFSLTPNKNKMMTEIRQEEICKEHSRKIEDLMENSHTNKEILIKLSADIEHVKSRIDNGMSTTITKIWDKVNEMSEKMVTMDGIVLENNRWIERLKNAFVWIGITAIGGGLVAIAFRLLENKQ